jgi:hypothetical protein
MRSLRVLAVVLASFGLLAAPAAQARASAPDQTALQIQANGAVAVYTLPDGNGSWYVNFGTGSYKLNGQTISGQPAMASGIFDSSCTPDGSSCSGYGVDGVAVVPAGTFTIAANLVLLP